MSIDKTLQRFAFHVLQHQVVLSTGTVDVKDVDHIAVIDGGQMAGFVKKLIERILRLQSFSIDDLDDHSAFHLFVFRQERGTRFAGTQLVQQLVLAQIGGQLAGQDLQGLPAGKKALVGQTFSDRSSVRQAGRHLPRGLHIAVSLRIPLSLRQSKNCSGVVILITAAKSNALAILGRPVGGRAYQQNCSPANQAQPVVAADGRPAG